MTHPVIVVSIYCFCSFVAWWPGNRLLGLIWLLISKYPGKSEAQLKRSQVTDHSPFIGQVGGLERMLYVMGVMSHHYELVGGWLVLKAFFGFLNASQEPARMHRQNGKLACHQNAASGQDEIMARYNGMLIGNAISLLIGLSAGAASNLLFRVFTKQYVDWWPL